MRHILNSVIVLFAILFCGCQLEEKRRFQDLLDNKLNITNDIQYVVIIPNEGCGGCISHMEDFYNRHKNNKSILYIFTNIVSKKILINKIGSPNENTILDYKNEIMNYYPNDKRIYPCILEIYNRKIKEVYYQSPFEDGIAIIK